jgi:hypothetical protein
MARNPLLQGAQVRRCRLLVAVGLPSDLRQRPVRIHALTGSRLLSQRSHQLRLTNLQVVLEGFPIWQLRSLQPWHWTLNRPGRYYVRIFLEVNGNGQMDADEPRGEVAADQQPGQEQSFTVRVRRP